MMSRKWSIILSLGLICSLMLTACGGDKAPAPAGEPVDSAFEYYDTYGRVLSVEPAGNTVYIVAEGYYGYHLDEDPAMTVGVTISDEGVITKVVLLDSRNHSDGYAEMITQDYIDETYTNLPSNSQVEVDHVAGATMTSQAVLYGVQTAAYYAENAYGYVADLSGEDIADLEAVYAADYTPIKAQVDMDATRIGTVLFAAEGVAADGTEVVAMKIRSGTRPNYKGSSDTGWPNAEPNPYTMVIVIDKATDEVIAYDVLVDGTKRTEFFVVPDEKIEAYKAVAITSEDIFDDFTDGLVFEIDVETETAQDGTNVITGTSVIYTGASVDGTFSSQFVRQCFRAAARFYTNYAS